MHYFIIWVISCFLWALHAQVNIPIHPNSIQNDPYTYIQQSWQALYLSNELISFKNPLIGSSIWKEAPSSPSIFESETPIKDAQKLFASGNYSHAKRLLINILNKELPDSIRRQGLCLLSMCYEKEAEYVMAAQIMGMYARLFSHHPSVLEAILRQGILYRMNGAYSVALSKFYNVLSTALVFNPDEIEYYQQLVLLAQTEIAQTYYLAGEYKDASELYQRLIKIESSDLIKERIMLNQLKSLSMIKAHEAVLQNAQQFIKNTSQGALLIEGRLILAQSLKELGRVQEALEQILLILNYMEKASTQDQKNQKGVENFRPWIQQVGNLLANQLYEEGDYISALLLYQRLLNLNNSPYWQIPVIYQIGLANERLNHTDQAIKQYQQIVDLSSSLKKEDQQALSYIINMAKWRIEFLNWYSQLNTKIPTRLVSSESSPTPTSTSDIDRSPTKM